MADKEPEVAIDCSNPDVVTKYRLAGEINSNAMAAVIALCKTGARIVDICEAGDKIIEEATSKIYNKGKDKVTKGIGFPTCVSVNNVVGHFSPDDKDDTVLKEGDVAKIDIGTHIDGYLAIAAHTLTVGAEGPAAVATGRAGDVLAAAYTASELALRMLKVGGKNTAITKMINQVAEDYKVSPVQGVLSHNLLRFKIDGEKVIINKEDTDNKVEEVEFAPNEAYAIDIVMSTGEGKPHEVDERTTVFKRSVESTYQLKMKASRAILSDIQKRFPTFPFTIRSMDAKTARFGINECHKHDLVSKYPVLQEKDGEIVAHVKFTALLLPNGTIRITNSNIDATKFSSEHSLTDEDLKKLLLTSAAPKKKNNKKKKKPAAAKAE